MDISRHKRGDTPRSRRLIHRGVGVVTAVTVLATLAACSSGGQTPPKATDGASTTAADPGKSVTLTMYANVTFKPGFDAVLAAFTKQHPNIKVDITYGQQDDVNRVNTTQIQAGNPGDLIPASPGSNPVLPVFKLGASGELVDLSDQPAAKKMPDMLKPALGVDGKIYTVASIINTNYFGFTTPVLEKWNVQPPKTWQDVLGLCKTARQHDAYAMADGLGEPISNQLKLQSFAAGDVYASAPDWDAQRAAGKVTFENTPGWHAAFQQFVDMMDSDCFYPGAAGRKWNDTLALLAQNKAVAGIHPSLSWTQLHKASPGRVIGTSPVPGASEVALPITGSITFGVSKKSKHITEALTFLNFTVDHSDLMAKGAGGISIDQFNSGQLPDYLSAFDSLVKAGKATNSAGVMWPNPQVMTAATDGITGIATGKKNIDEILKAMDTAWDKGSK